ncbi:1-acyl-sn-glycerol-3-phosphate acyltransferase [Iodidimonas muriae]|uniref:1-acyl-sn-glycerol-3-phosphate acyltransferase n=1 Tax=Iodidimonas muriae TaxID=261467 RepID=A0ABQ2LC57_9PROT|nr:lysophospholipid acyltransferase family protein [Iodidimonas muriae]GER06752.1 1-acyl-sn-glycerol-3-phosphate acyltransferase [Kordiimonadales bacterium JCM 17843]GGO10129.1 1-acyl-sn-glycerol-3-phosphate acyltransferase [Iodidimonas muriae]
MRSLLYNTSFYILTLVWATGLLITLPMRGRKPLAYGIWLWTCMVLWLLRVVAGIKVDVRGTEHLPKDTALIIVSKHMSDLDPIVTYNVAPNMTALAKKELFRIPVIGLLLRKLKVARIDRQSGTAHQEMPRVVRNIREGKRPLVVYPEGTRARVGEKKRLKSGAFYLQEDGVLPAIPMATNSGLHWPKGRFRRMPGTVVYEIGAPLAHTKNKASFMAEVEEKVIMRSEQLMQEDPVYSKG